MSSKPRWALAATGLAVVALLPLQTLLASDPPHWTSPKQQTAGTLFNCSKQCHTLHQAAGGTLTAAAGNVNLCQSCHSGSGMASGLPVNTGDMAVPDTGGIHHAFGVNASNASYGAQAPVNAQMSLRVMGGQVVCSTCHDQHAAQAADGGNSDVRPITQVTALGSLGAVTSGGAFTGANGLWYLIEITTAGAPPTAKFRWSKDNGLTWAGSNVSTAITPVALDNGVTVTFSAANFALNERYQFTATWAFLRATMDSGDNATGSNFCRDCHRSWVMDHTGAETYTGTARSHPVGVVLNANGAGYDRAAPLDGNGAVQGSGGADTNPSNDLKTDAGGRVQCMSCHGAHYMPGNTATAGVP